MTEVALRDLMPGTVVEPPPELVALDPKMGPVMYMGADLDSLEQKHLYPLFRKLEGGAWKAFQGKGGLPSHKLTLASEKVATNMREAITKIVPHLVIPGTRPTSGTDPEIFVLDEHGDLLPAWLFLKDKKQSSELFYDGAQAEFTTPGKSCLEALGDCIHYALERVLASAQKFDKKAKLTLANTVQLSDAVVKKSSDEQLRFRCTPSINVYNDSDGILPDYREYRYRFAGGHIHLGLAPRPGIVTSEIVKALDAILGVAGVSLAAGIDGDERRKMYGRCGEFRLPKHGIEYRVLSNFWLCHPAIMHLVFETMREAYRLGSTGLFRIAWTAKEEAIREVVNHNDVTGARKMLEANKHVLAWMYQNVWGNSKSAKKAVEAVLNGVGTAVEDPMNIHRNWHLLTGTWSPYCGVRGVKWRSLCGE